MEQMAPLLIKTMAVMGHQMSNMIQLLKMKDKRINALEERLDVLEADKREQYSRCPNLRFHGIPESCSSGAQPPPGPQEGRDNCAIPERGDPERGFQSVHSTALTKTRLAS